MGYLTIDDVPSRRFEEKLDFLKARKVPALLFCVGRDIAGREDALADALRSGYALGNHSYSHRHFSELSLEECQAEIEDTDALISSLYARAGVPWTRKFFRFPYLDLGAGLTAGGQAARIQEMLRASGYSCLAAQPGGRADTGCDFDQMEYFLGKSDAPDGLDKGEKILARIDSDHPACDDIVMIHDHLESHELFFECVNRYLANGIRFSPIG